MNKPYKITLADFLAKEFCNNNGIVCEFIPVNNESRVIIIDENRTDKSKDFFILKKPYTYGQEQEALYETYRAITSKFQDNGNI